MAGPSLRSATVAQVTRIYVDCRDYAGAWHWRQHGNLHAGTRHHVAFAARGESHATVPHWRYRPMLRGRRVSGRCVNHWRLLNFLNRPVSIPEELSAGV